MIRRPAAIFLVLALAALALALVPAVGVAARGGIPGGNGNGHGNGGGGGGTTATLASSCNPCAAGTVVHFSGSGYDPSQGVAQLDISGAFTSTAVYAGGTVSFDWPYFNMPGSYTVKAYQHKGGGGRLVLKAEVTVAVE